LFVLRAVADDGSAATADLTWIEVGDLGVYVERWDGPREVTRDGMLEHHRALSRIHEQVDCLPVRFPTWSEDPASLVSAKRAELIASLNRVRGKSELAITLVWQSSPLPLGEGRGEGVLGGVAGARPHPEPLPEGEGTTYLRQKRLYWAARRERETDARSWAEQLGPGAIVRVCPNERVAVSAALLVPRGRAEDASLSLPPALTGTRCVVNGPWPPYSFATVE
jgi:hypothetical protein